MADADVPALGKVNKPTLVVAGIAAVGAAAWAYYKHKKDAAAAAAATTQASAYGYGYGAAGYGYGAELAAQEQALAQQYAYGGNYASGYGYGVTGGGTAVNVPAQNVPVSNSQWVAYAQTFLGSQGYNTSLVGTTLNEYVSGQSVGANQGIVEAAIAFEGDPPVAGANGYPPSINTGGSNAGQPSSSSVQTASNKEAGAISNLALKANGTTGFTARWNPATGATGGYSYATTGGGVNKTGHTTGTSATVTGLKKGVVYNFGIQALPGGAGNNEHITL